MLNTRQYHIQIFNKIIVFKYGTRQIKTTETNKLNWYKKMTTLEDDLHSIDKETEQVWDWTKEGWGVGGGAV